MTELRESPMRNLVVLAVLTTLLAVAFFAWPVRGPAGSPAAAPVVEAAAPDAIQLASESAPETPASTERAEVPASEAPPTGPLATLRGRCVDEKGVPIAGVVAGLLGWGGNSQRTEAWLKDHPEPNRINAKLTIGADGVFEFRFWPPPPFQFGLRLTKAGRATMSERWSELEPGSTTDLGDIVMAMGTVLRGKVVDTAGAPVSDVELRFQRNGRSVARGGTVDWATGHARPANEFVANWPLAAGEYDVTAVAREVVSPATVTITGEQTAQVVDVVLAVIDPAGLLCGVVDDDAGRPVAGARVRFGDDEDGFHWSSDTDQEGRFRVMRPSRGGPARVGLQLDASGFEFLKTSEKYAWGRDDLRIVLQRGIDLEVTVVAAGAPVEDFVLRIFPRGFRISSDDYLPRARGKHPGGRVVVPGVRRGDNLVVVEPADRELTASDPVPVDVVAPGPTRLTVSVARVATRTLQVREADGKPLAGARVQLADPMGHPGEARIDPLSQWFWARTSALELQATTTDARGEAVLRGPGGRTLAVSLPGPGHAPIWQGDVRLEVEAPLVIFVDGGARLAGSVGPPELLQEWRRLAGIPLAGRLEEEQRRMGPRVSLTRSVGGAREQYPGPGVPLDERGDFEIEGAPSGTWQLVVSWTRSRGGGMSTGESVNAGLFELRSEETTRVDVDLSHLVPGDLEGSVLHNGAPWANGRVRVVPVADASGGRQGRSESASTDADGRFHLRLPSGEYELALELASERRSDTLRAGGSVRVVRGERTTRTFDVRSGSVRVRLLDASGVAVVGVLVELRDAADKPRTWLAATGADGWTTGELEAGVFSACVLPRRLQDQKAQQEVWRANVGNPDPFAAMRLRLGTVTARVGETMTIELRLPPEFEK